MNKFIEVPFQNSNVLINTEQIVYVSHSSSSSTIHLNLYGADSKPVSLIIEMDYESVKRQLGIH